MRYILALVLLCIVFVPNLAFGWKSISYDNPSCGNCSNVAMGLDYSQPTNFILLGVAGIFGLCVFYKFTKTKRFEVFSITCDDCGKITNGLKCQFCGIRN